MKKMTAIALAALLIPAMASAQTAPSAPGSAGAGGVATPIMSQTGIGLTQGAIAAAVIGVGVIAVLAGNDNGSSSTTTTTPSTN
jgi:hypothetical protein